MRSADAFPFFSAEDESFFAIDEDAILASTGFSIEVLIRICASLWGALALAVSHVEVMSFFAILFIAFAITNVFVPGKSWSAVAWRALALTFVFVPELMQVVL